tara:strand:- start:56 stop:1159 length:1104 start_codon:yes stop_codon:yes gene_type:complete
MAGLRAKASAFGHPKAPHSDVLRERHFTSAMQIVLPKSSDSDARAGLSDVSGVLGCTPETSTSGSSERTARFYLADLSLGDLLEQGFLGTHVRGNESKTKLYALNADGSIDVDDILAITPSGQLHVSLTERAYRRLGVSGVTSDDGTAKRRCVVNIGKKNFKPGGQFRNRLVENALSVSTTDTSLAKKRKYFVQHTVGVDEDLRPVEFPEGCVWTEHKLKCKSKVMKVNYNDVPTLPSSLFPKTNENDMDDDTAPDIAETLSTFHEWLGKVCCGKYNEGDGDFAIETHVWSGFLIPTQTTRALQFCREQVRDGKPWAAMTTWGFPDDPSGGNKMDGGGNLGGLQGGGHVSFVIVPGDGYVMYTQPGR